MKRWNKRSGVNMAEDFRIEIDKVFKEFMNDSELTDYTFPTNLSNLQRKYIHERCRVLGLKSKSHGVEPNRAITVTKKDRTDLQITCRLSLRSKSNDILNEFVNTCGKWANGPDNFNKKFQRYNATRNSYGKLIIPNKPLSNPFGEFRVSLPIFPLKPTILNLLETSQVLIVSAETGSGKTTQVPQYLLEQATELQKPCRIICTQPRRISTVAVSERVAAERGENLGNTVGYQIKLESKTSQNTALIYCTNGVLLKTLMNLNNNLDCITHVVVDEIHERDKYSDFLLICLREQLKKCPNLRVILMSASMDIDSLAGYFPGSQKISIPGRLFPISDIYLAEILRTINYESYHMKVLKEQRQQSPAPIDTSKVFENVDEFNEDMNFTIQECVNTNSDDSFMQLQQLIISEGNSVNYKEDETGFTPLIVASLHGRLDVVEQFLVMGADPTQVTNTGLSSIEAAKQNSHVTTYQFLEEFMKNQNIPLQEEPQEDILKLYNETVFNDNIDFSLIRELIIYIHEKVDPLGGILVFLPGYEDILMCYDHITNSSLNMEKIEVFMLHGSMQIGAQNKVFKRLHNKQKIVLATNVAETSITIDDICFVIDSGRAKEKSYDANTNTHSLDRTWISKACIKQRSGRAGRTRNGICFHLFSELRYNALLDNSTPEILRVPLEEICLQTKAFAASSMNIATFLSLALQPPAPIAIQKAIQSLVLLGALDENENLTTLGRHLLQISALPNLGKMLIYAVIFKCLEPILTIVASLNQKDPFILPSSGSDKTEAANKRKELSENTFSDHMSFLRAFQRWQEAKSQQREYKFCKEYFVSASAMTTINQTRNQLLSQLKTQGFIGPRETFEDLNVYSESWPLIKAVLLNGIYPQLAFLNDGVLSTRTEKKVVCHFSSSIQKAILKTNTASDSWFMYDELSKAATLATMKCITLINPAAVCLVAGKSELTENEVIIDNWLSFQTPNQQAITLRKAIDKMIAEKIENSLYIRNEYKQVLHTLNTILVDQDVAIGLPQPACIAVKQFFNHRQNFQHQNRRHFEEPQFTQQNRRQYDEPHSSRSSSSNWRQPQNTWQPPGPKKYHMGQNNFQRGNANFKPHHRQNNHTNSSHLVQNQLEIPPHSKYFYICENVSGGMSFNCNFITLSPIAAACIQNYVRNKMPVVLLLSPRNSGYFIGSAMVHDVGNDFTCSLQWLSKRKVFFRDIREKANVRLRLFQEGEELDAITGGKISQAMIQLQ